MAQGTVLTTVRLALTFYFFLVFLMVYALGDYCIDKYTCLEVIFLLIWQEMA